MFACLYLPPPVKQAQGSGLRAQGGTGLPAFAKATAGGQPCPQAGDVLQLARDFSPRVETHGPGLVTLDIRGLGSLLGDARAIGEELRRAAADRSLRVHVAIAATTTTAMLLAQSRAGLVVIPAGEEAQALAPLPLSALQALAPHAPHAPEILRRWGLRTLGDLAALPSADLSERLGQQGLLWQRWARGQDARPLVPAGVEDAFEEALDLEWPIEGLEPLSFVLARLFEPLCERLEQRDRGAVALHVTLTLVDKQQHERSLQLPAPMRDARVLRTLALLDLESHPPAAAIDRVTVGVEVTEGRVLQFGLFARALPTERLATLMARLGALMGERSRGRAGAGGLASPRRLRHGDVRTEGGAIGHRQQRPESFRASRPGSRLQASASGANRRGARSQKFRAQIRRAPVPVPDSRARHAGAGAPGARDHRSPRLHRRRGGAVRRPVALIGRLVARTPRTSRTLELRRVGRDAQRRRLVSDLTGGQRRARAATHRARGGSSASGSEPRPTNKRCVVCPAFSISRTDRTIVHGPWSIGGRWSRLSTDYRLSTTDYRLPTTDYRHVYRTPHRLRLQLPRRRVAA